MRKNDRNILIFMLISLLITVVLSLTIFSEQYLFNYLNHNHIFSIVILLIPITLLLLKKKIASIISFIGIYLGLFLADFLGELIHSINVSKIDNLKNAEEIARLHNYPSFYIWITIIIISIIIGLITQKLFKVKEN